MQMNDRIQLALMDQFMSWYAGWDQPESWSDWAANDLERNAARSAATLRRSVGDELVPELAALLREGSRERKGPLVREIESWTQLYWSGPDDTWAALQKLLVRIADLLEAPPAT